MKSSNSNPLPTPAPRTSPQGVARQSSVTLLAWNELGADAATTFLNEFHPALGGRPLDVAAASVAGCEAVERMIAARVAGE